MNASRLLLVIAFVSLVFASVAVVFSDNTPHHIDTAVLSEGEYETIVIDTTTDDMNAAGYHIGDQLRVTIGDDSFTVTYVEKYTGIGVMGGFASTTDHWGDHHIRIGYFNVDAWKKTGASMGDKVSLDYAGKDPNMSKIPKYLKGSNRSYDGSITPEVFCNYREIHGGNLKEGEFYRSVAPFGVGYDSTPLINDIYTKIGIEYIVDLGDDASSIERCRQAYGDDLYALQLYDSGNVFAEHLFPDVNIRPEVMKTAMCAVIESEGKTIVCCYLGKDRTGMTCAMLQSLAGSSYEDVKRDYMFSYVDLYGVEEGSEEYETLGKMMFDRYFYLLGHPGIEDQAEDFDWSVIDGYEFDLKSITENFLREKSGMTEEEMELLMERITK